jgi:hypothetical protein
VSGQAVFGAALVLASLALMTVPKVTLWIGDQTNLRWARWWSEHVYPVPMEGHERNQRFLRWAVPLFLLFLGSMIILDSFVSLQR